MQANTEECCHLRQQNIKAQTQRQQAGKQADIEEQEAAISFVFSWYHTPAADFYILYQF